MSDAAYRERTSHPGAESITRPCRHVIRVDDVDYLAGSAGGAIVACPRCGQEHFREPMNVWGGGAFGHISWHVCLTCEPRSQMEAIRMDELLTRWFPFWEAKGWGPCPPKPHTCEYCDRYGANGTPPEPANQLQTAPKGET